MLKYHVYVLRNSEGRFYIGVSEDVAVRLAQHNSGGSGWTRSRGPWALAWTSEAMSLGEARRQENWLKRQKGGLGFFRHTGLTKNGPGS
jgi:putative endonuclease